MLRSEKRYIKISAYFQKLGIAPMERTHFFVSTTNNVKGEKFMKLCAQTFWTFMINHFLQTFKPKRKTKIQNKTNKK